MKVVFSGQAIRLVRTKGNYMPADDDNYNNEAERDASNGINRPPHDGFKMACHGFIGGDTYKQLKEENEAYQAGQDNYRNQTGG